jgi:Rab-GTPase-TBC domain
MDHQTSRRISQESPRLALRSDSSDGSPLHVETSETSTSAQHVPDEATQTNAPTNVSTFLNGQDNAGIHLPSASARDSETTFTTNNRSSTSFVSAPNIPQIRIDNGSEPRLQDQQSGLPLPPTISKAIENGSEAFLGITLDLPDGSLSEDIPTERMEFSNRGSAFIDGQKFNPKGRSKNGLYPGTGSRRVRSNPSMRDTPNLKLLSVEEESLSQKVRSFYEAGSETPANAEAQSSLGSKMGLRWQDALNNTEGSSVTSLSRTTSMTEAHSNMSEEPSLRGRVSSTIQREDNELAGGLEDWQDVDIADVDRYGFIIPKSPTTSSVMSDGNTQKSREPQPLQRVSTSLQLASETPRRNRTIKRSTSHANGSADYSRRHGAQPQQSESLRTRPATAQSARESLGRHSKMRHATNKLPHNRDRRLLDEAADMLTLPRVTDEGQVQYDERARRKETAREEKWRKMAQIVSSNSGGGMIFEFDTQNPTLIKRTWKGIPDRWRATAWYAFLSASAKRRKDAPTDDALIEKFYEYTSLSSPDDVQIDLDVPRTISSHIMFRRRYRGGQRLLFRVLHAMSLHFPDTGYVQGMATLAATLLAYYEEERTFVMLVRLWDLRGLDTLYKSGFGGLMQALNDFEKHWLKADELASKLVSPHPPSRRGV